MVSKKERGINICGVYCSIWYAFGDIVSNRSIKRYCTVVAYTIAAILTQVHSKKQLHYKYIEKHRRLIRTCFGPLVSIVSIVRV